MNGSVLEIGYVVEKSIDFRKAIWLFYGTHKLSDEK